MDARHTKKLNPKQNDMITVTDKEINTMAEHKYPIINKSYPKQMDRDPLATHRNIYRGGLIAMRELLTK